MIPFMKKPCRKILWVAMGSGLWTSPIFGGFQEVAPVPACKSQELHGACESQTLRNSTKEIVKLPLSEGALNPSVDAARLEPVRPEPIRNDDFYLEFIKKAYRTRKSIEDQYHLKGDVWGK